MAEAEVGALRVRLAMDAAEFSEGARDAGSSLDSLARRFGITATTAKIAGAAIGVAAVAAAVAIGDGVKSAIDRVSRIAELAEKFGAPVKLIGAFATEGKVAIETLSAGFEHLTQNMQEVVSGNVTSAAARSFAAIGVSVTDATDRLRPINDVLSDVADRFATYRDGVEKTALATNLFGKAGYDMLPILNEGSAGFDELTEGAAAAGTAIDAVTAAAAINLKANVDTLSTGFETFSNKLAVALLPTLDRVIEKVVATANQFDITDTAVAALTNGFKALVSAGVIVQGVFTAIRDAAVNLASVLKLVIEGEYTKALETYRASSEEANKSIAETIADVKTVWSDWATTLETTAATHKDKVAAPIIASIQSIRFEQEEWNRSVSAGVSLVEKLKTPYEIQTKQIEDLSNAYAAGRITAEQLAVAQQAAAYTAQSAYAGMAGSIANSLSAVFNQSKGVAIASALINTFESVTKALATYPPPFSYVAAAAALAAGMAQVANIRRTTKDGGGGGGGGGGAAIAAAGPTSIPQSLIVQGLGPGQLFTSESVKDLAGKLLDFQRDGGQVVIQ